MTRISIDSTNSSADVSKMVNIGDALKLVIGDIPTSRFVSEIEVDGKKIRHFISEEETARQLDTIQELKIHTADRAHWAASGFDTAWSSLDRIQRTLIVTAELFRENKSLEGNKLFIRCMDGLDNFWEAVTLTRSALKIEFKEIFVNPTWRLSDLELQFLDIIKGFVSLQDGQHYEAIADKIEFELIPHLSRWSEVLMRLRSAQDTNDLQSSNE